MYLIDTSALIEMMDATEKGASLLLEIGENPVLISAVTRYEYLSYFTGKSLEEEKRILRNLPVIDFTSDCADVAVEIHNTLKAQGNIIKQSDIMIASTCKKNNLILVTLDEHFSRVPGLSIKRLKTGKVGA